MIAEKLTNLTTLYVDGNNISEEGKKFLREWQKKNPKMTLDYYDHLSYYND